MAGDCTVKVVPFTCSTSSGDQDITGTGVGDPEAVIFLIGGDVTSLDTSTAHVLWQMGWTDGTRERSCMTISQDAAAASVGYRSMDDTKCIRLFDVGGTGDGDADFSAWTTDGVTINWANGAGGAYQGVAIFFSGADVSSYAGTYSTSSGTANVTDPSFEPDVVFSMTTRGAVSTSTSTNGAISVGVAINDGSDSQSSLNTSDATGQPTTKTAVMHQNAASARNIYDNLEFGGAKITTFDADGFSAEQVNSAGVTAFYLALKLDGCQVYGPGAFQDVPSSAGTQSYTVGSPGFVPQFVMTFSTWATAGSLGSLQNSDTLCETIGVGATDGTNERCLEHNSEDGAADTVCKTRMNTATVTCTEADLADTYAADFDSFDTIGGFTLDWTDVEAAGVALQWFYLAIEENSADAGPTLKTLTATASTTPSMGKQVGAGVEAVATASPTFQMQVGKALSDAVSTVASLATQLVSLRVLTATVSVTASFLKQVGKGVVSTVTGTPSFLKQVSTTLTATPASAPTMGKDVDFTMFDGVTVSASVNSLVGKALSVGVATATSIGKLVGKLVETATSTVATLDTGNQQLLVATVGTSASVRSAVQFQLATAVATVSSIVKQVTHPLTTAVSTVASLDTLRVSLKTLTATVTTAASIGKTVGVGLTVGVVGSVSFVVQISKELLASTATTPSVAKQMQQELSSAVATVASLSTVQVALQVLTATVSTAATMGRTVGVILTVPIATVSTFAKAISKTLSRAVSAVPSLVHDGGILPTLVELVATVSTSASMGKRIAKQLVVRVRFLARLVASLIVPPPPPTPPPPPPNDNFTKSQREHLYPTSIEMSYNHPWRVTKWAEGYDVLGQPEEDDA